MVKRRSANQQGEDKKIKRKKGKGVKQLERKAKKGRKEKALQRSFKAQEGHTQLEWKFKSGEDEEYWVLNI